jgi:P-loop containing dynein motor region
VCFCVLGARVLFQQGATELLRQVILQGGWSGDDNTFKAIQDVTVVAAMQKNGGAWSGRPESLLGNFNAISLPEVRDAPL